MWALVVQGKHLIAIGTKYGNITLRSLHHTRTQMRDISYVTNFCPFSHIDTFSVNF
jgi:hypothetical protein